VMETSKRNLTKEEIERIRALKKRRAVLQSKSRMDYIQGSAETIPQPENLNSFLSPQEIEEGGGGCEYNQKYDSPPKNEEVVEKTEQKISENQENNPPTGTSNVEELENMTQLLASLKQQDSANNQLQLKTLVILCAAFFWLFTIPFSVYH